MDEGGDCDVCLTVCSFSPGGSRHLSVEEESSMTTTLVINNIVETDSGIYTCTVGEYDNEFDITIQGEYLLVS